MAEEVDHQHGSTGTKPPQDRNFEDGDYPDPEEFDWFWSQVPSAINNHKQLIEALDSDENGNADKAESGAAGFTFDAGAEISGDWSDDQSNTIWDYSEQHVPSESIEQGAGSGFDADSVDGKEPPFMASVSDDGTVVVSVPDDVNATTGLSVSDDGDNTVTIEVVGVPGNDDVVHKAGSLPRYADTTEAEANSSEGDVVYVEADNSMYLNNGA